MTKQTPTQKEKPAIIDEKCTLYIARFLEQNYFVLWTTKHSDECGFAISKAELQERTTPEVYEDLVIELAQDFIIRKEPKRIVILCPRCYETVTKLHMVLGLEKEDAEKEEEEAEQGREENKDGSNNDDE